MLESDVPGRVLGAEATGNPALTLSGLLFQRSWNIESNGEQENPSTE